MSSAISVSFLSRGTQKYKCSACDWRTSNINTFKKHLLVHERARGKVTKTELNIPCPKCGKVYQTKSGLSRHIKLVHEGGAHEKTPCPYCGQIFNSSGGLHYHLRTVHNYVGERTKRRQMTVGKVEVKNEGQVGVVATNSNVVDSSLGVEGAAVDALLQQTQLQL